ncbi:MAG: DUF5666 domain-containing protein [Terracidiphilus sp.]|nr:DUF5666 domain-containing protein [Terracidiphilus sp.]
MKLFRAVAMMLMAVATAAAAQDGGGMGQRGGRGGMGMMAIGNRHNVMGTVTEAAADHFTVKTYLNETYVVHYSVNTHFFKMPAGMGGGMGRGEGMRRREEGQQGQGGRMEGFASSEIKSTEIKVGDDIGAMGEIDPVKKEAGAVTIVLMDPERARAMRETMAGFGKTWLMGKVTGIDGVKIAIESQVDGQKYAIVADENTTLRKRRDPITLADIQVGDTVRAEGSMKAGAFTAATINVMAMPQGGPPQMPRNGQPPAPQQ